MSNQSCTDSDMEQLRVEISEKTGLIDTLLTDSLENLPLRDTDEQHALAYLLFYRGLRQIRENCGPGAVTQLLKTALAREQKISLQ